MRPIGSAGGGGPRGDAGRAALRLGIPYQQLDYWLTRMGLTGMGTGARREIPPAVEADVRRLVAARARCQEEIDSILSRYPRGLSPKAAKGLRPRPQNAPR